MPEALARSDFDFVVRQPREERRPRGQNQKVAPGASKRQAPRNGRAQPAWQRVALANRGRIISFGLMVIIALAILVNALILQKGHRVSVLLPLFPHAVANLANVPLPPLPPKSLAQSALARQALSELAATTTSQAHADAGPSASTIDSISSLLQGANDSAAPTASATMLLVQKALVKLGYNLKPDGVFGKTTRLAIARFQRSEHLSVTGDADLKLRQHLAARSGFTIK